MGKKNSKGSKAVVSVVSAIAAIAGTSVAALRAAALATPFAPESPLPVSDTGETVTLPRLPTDYNKRAAAHACYVQCNENRTLAAMLLTLCGGARTARNDSGLCKGELRGKNVSLLGYIKPNAIWWDNASVVADSKAYASIIAAIEHNVLTTDTPDIRCIEYRVAHSGANKLAVLQGKLAVEPVTVEPVTVEPVTVEPINESVE